MKARTFRLFFDTRSIASGCLAVLTSLMVGEALAQDDPEPPPGAARPKAVDRRKTLFDKVDAARKKRAETAKPAAPGAAPAAAPAAAPGAAANPGADRDPPGAAPQPPSTMDKIAQATDVPFRAKPGG
ncbi:MAG TPA: hypothetical protein VEX18_17250, partial [Polyangiaceae bacterium]|nr:hypothetical protein [Polyangiaceae bacterium]